MYTRVVEITAKPGKARELCQTINQEILPILQQQSGFVDEVVMTSETDPNRVLALSFWKRKEDAERYHQNQFNVIQDKLRNHAATTPRVQPFNVHTSVAHGIAAEKAA